MTNCVHAHALTPPNLKETKFRCIKRKSPPTDNRNDSRRRLLNRLDMPHKFPDAGNSVWTNRVNVSQVNYKGEGSPCSIPPKCSDQSRPDLGQAVALKLSQTDKSPGGCWPSDSDPEVWAQGIFSQLPSWGWWHWGWWVCTRGVQGATSSHRPETRQFFLSLQLEPSCPPCKAPGGADSSPSEAHLCPWCLLPTRAKSAGRPALLGPPLP